MPPTIAAGTSAGFMPKDYTPRMKRVTGFVALLTASRSRHASPARSCCTSLPTVTAARSSPPASTSRRSTRSTACSPTSPKHAKTEEQLPPPGLGGTGAAVRRAGHAGVDEAREGGRRRRPDDGRRVRRRDAAAHAVSAGLRAAVGRPASAWRASRAASHHVRDEAARQRRPPAARPAAGRDAIDPGPDRRSRCSRPTRRRS